MKHYYMAELFLPNEIDDEFMRLIPSHRAYINELIVSDIIISYSIELNRTKGWILFYTEDMSKVERYINNFPIRTFISYDVYQLLVQDGEMFKFPKIVFN